LIPDHSSAREEFTNIRVTREGKWFTGIKEIVNWKVVSHFKQHLFRDEKGIYIYQTFRQFSEKGYITVEGPLLAVFRVEADKIILDSLDEIGEDAADVIVNTEDELPYVLYPRLRCYASVPAAVAPYFSEVITETAGGFLVYGRPVRREAISSWVK